jgi:REP element-mobilizing transposase RayT
MPPRRPQQLTLPAPRTWGGPRRGAGRKPSLPRPGPAHAPRPQHSPRHPTHVTLRARTGLPSLRSPAVFPTLQRALAATSRRGFRLIHFSVQSDHLHLISEADTALALTRGLQGLAIRCARAINRACRRRGAVWDHRYHAHPLATPREVRRGLVYVLLNFRKHLRAAPGVDPCSSGLWFDGWKRRPPAPSGPPPIASPRTWLAAIGWQRAGGRIDSREAPAASSRPRDGRAGRGTGA